MKPIYARLGIHIWLLTGLPIIAGAAEAPGFSLESVGARIGGSGTDRAHDFHQAEAFVNCNLPWKWDLGKDWRLQSRFDLSGGWLADPGRDAAIVTAGPSLLLGKAQFPLSFEGGASPTLISRHEFETKDFGTPFQFTSHLGLNLDWRHYRVGYRFQHMSNAGISDRNPGLNLHVIALSYLF
ncbi:MAG TPA: acyloxyacyl hydrolase [Candidatus Binatia bacterium]|jgi:lipid A 3-O-deacylase|nr:acyloxyacyl hydrolase [Candidatus Binatia bacterium]